MDFGSLMFYNDDGSIKNKHYILQVGSIQIGSSDNSHIRIKKNSVDPTHALIQCYADGTVTLHKKCSQDGILTVNSVPVTHSTRLKHSDEIIIGTKRITYLCCTVKPETEEQTMSTSKLLLLGKEDSPIRQSPAYSRHSLHPNFMPRSSPRILSRNVCNLLNTQKNTPVKEAKPDNEIKKKENIVARTYTGNLSDNGDFKTPEKFVNQKNVKSAQKDYMQLILEEDTDVGQTKSIPKNRKSRSSMGLNFHAMAQSASPFASKLNKTQSFLTRRSVNQHSDSSLDSSRVDSDLSTPPNRKTSDFKAIDKSIDEELVTKNERRVTRRTQSLNSATPNSCLNVRLSNSKKNKRDSSVKENFPEDNDCLNNDGTAFSASFTNQNFSRRRSSKYMDMNSSSESTTDKNKSNSVQNSPLNNSSTSEKLPQELNNSDAVLDETDSIQSEEINLSWSPLSNYNDNRIPEEIDEDFENNSLMDVQEHVHDDKMDNGKSVEKSYTQVNKSSKKFILPLKRLNTSDSSLSDCLASKRSKSLGCVRPVKKLNARKSLGLQLISSTDSLSTRRFNSHGTRRSLRKKEQNDSLTNNRTTNLSNEVSTKQVLNNSNDSSIKASFHSINMEHMDSSKISNSSLKKLNNSTTLLNGNEDKDSTVTAFSNISTIKNKTSSRKSSSSTLRSRRSCGSLMVKNKKLNRFSVPENNFKTSNLEPIKPLRVSKLVASTPNRKSLKNNTNSFHSTPKVNDHVVFENDIILNSIQDLSKSSRISSRNRKHSIIKNDTELESLEKKTVSIELFSSAKKRNMGNKSLEVNKLNHSDLIFNRPSSSTKQNLRRSLRTPIKTQKSDFIYDVHIKSLKNSLILGKERQLEMLPKVQKSTNVAGVKRLPKTQKVQKSPRNDLTNVAGVKKLLKTPKIQKSPINDLTNVAGVKRLLKTPRVQKSPRNDLTNVAGVKKLLKTPKIQKSPINDLTNVAGVKRLLKTPRVQKSPRNDLTNVAGVKKLLKTPKIQKSPINDLTNVAGVKKLLKTPRVQKSPRNDLTNVAGVKKLLKTPKIQNSPKNDLTNVCSLKKIFNLPKTNDHNVSFTGLDVLFTEDAFDNLTGKKAIKTYTPSPRRQKPVPSNLNVSVAEVSDRVVNWVEEQNEQKNKLVENQVQNVRSTRRRKALELEIKDDILTVNISEEGNNYASKKKAKNENKIESTSTDKKTRRGKKAENQITIENKDDILTVNISEEGNNRASKKKAKIESTSTDKKTRKGKKAENQITLENKDDILMVDSSEEGNNRGSKKKAKNENKIESTSTDKKTRRGKKDENQITNDEIILEETKNNEETVCKKVSNVKVTRTRNSKKSQDIVKEEMEPNKDKAVDQKKEKITKRGKKHETETDVEASFKEEIKIPTRSLRSRNISCKKSEGQEKEKIDEDKKNSKRSTTDKKANTSIETITRTKKNTKESNNSDDIDQKLSQNVDGNRKKTKKLNNADEIIDLELSQNVSGRQLRERKRIKSDLETYLEASNQLQKRTRRK